MIKALSSKGKLILIHSCGNDPGMEIIKNIWPDENPFPSLAKDIISYIKDNNEKDLLKKLIFNNPEIFQYYLRSLPNEIENSIATSLIFSSWNAATYVGQIDNEKIITAEKTGLYIKHVQEILKKYDGLWFNDEMLVIENI